MRRFAKPHVSTTTWLSIVFAAAVPAADARGDTPLPIGSKVGQAHADFLLPRTDGGFGRLSDYRGKKVLLIHFASW